MASPHGHNAVIPTVRSNWPLHLTPASCLIASLS